MNRSLVTICNQFPIRLFSDHYEAIELSGQLKPLDGISIGDFGVAKFSDDNRWYRARLLTVVEDNHIRIVYIDYGNIETKYIDEFFPLERIFTGLPARAVACSLSKVNYCVTFRSIFFLFRRHFLEHPHRMMRIQFGPKKQ